MVLQCDVKFLFQIEPSWYLGGQKKKIPSIFFMNLGIVKKKIIRKLKYR